MKNGKIINTTHNKDFKMEELLEQLSAVPWIKDYIECVPPEFLEMIFGAAGISVRAINGTVIEAEFKNPGGVAEKSWKYYVSEPYPGIRVMSGNITGLVKLIGIGKKMPESETSVIHYCVKGRCEILTKDGMYVFMEPGVLCLESHKHKEKNFNFFGEDYEGVEIGFDLDKFDEDQINYLQSLGVDIMELKERYERDADYYIGNVTELLKASIMELDGLMKNDSVDNLTIFLSALRIINQIKTGNVQTDTNKFYLTKGQRKIVSEVHDQLVGSLDTGVTVEALAKKYGISPISLNKYFSIMYGDTVHKYLQSYRMDHAAKLLSDTDKSIADIALDIGYENQGKFATLFKRIYGMSPLEYRRCKK